MIYYKLSVLGLGLALGSLISAESETPSLRKVILDIPNDAVRGKIERAYMAGNFDEVKSGIINFVDEYNFENGEVEDVALSEPSEGTEICGQEVPSDIDNFLNPPEIFQEIISVGFGISYGYGPIDTGGSDACTGLGEVMGSHDYIYVDVKFPAQVGFLILKGEDAVEMGQERYQNSGSESEAMTSDSKKSSNLESAVNFLDAVLPICMAMRPCGVDDPAGTWLKEFTFGAYIDPGITIPASPFEFSLFGVAVSTAGDLDMPLTASLYNDETPEGMHAWIKAGISTPFGTSVLNIGSLDFNGQLGIYGEVNGSPQIGTLIDSLINGGGFNPNSMSDALSGPDSARLQLFADVAVSLVFDLSVLMGIFGLALEFSLGGVSTMFDFNYMKDDLYNTWIDLYLSSEVTIETLNDVVKKALIDKCGDYGVDLASMVPEITPSGEYVAEMGSKMMFKLRADGSFDFGFVVHTEATMICDTFETAIDAIATLIALYPGDQTSLTEKVITPVQDILDAVCGESVSLSISMEFISGVLQTENTCFEANAGSDSYQICMDKFPVCPAPVAPDGKCSSNTDCEGDDYPYGGYCHNDETWSTSIGCLGTCIHKIEDGSDCSSDWANLPFYSSIDFTDAEDEACRSGHCLCDVCANTDSGKLANGYACSENDDCESGYCLGWITVDCNGICVEKASDGADCSSDVAETLTSENEYCSSGQCVCDKCADTDGKLPSGSECSWDDDCESGDCEGWFTVGCNGECK